MKQRVISATACVAVLILVLCFYNTIVLNTAVSVLGACAVYELLKAHGFSKTSPLTIGSVAFATILPYLTFFNAEKFLVAAYAVFIVAFVLKFHSSVKFEKICYAVVSTVFVSFSFLCIVLLRNNFEKNALLYIILVFATAWYADTGAFFGGKFFGKHKLSPVISPKKTVEGAIGGVISDILLVDLTAYVYSVIMGSLGTSVSVNYLFLSLLAFFASFASMAGDLTASVIKRQVNIKDYGNVIPGHGGIMDRFDSILFTAPVIFFVSGLITIAE